MQLLHNRLIRGYGVLLLGILALIARRLLAPDILDISQISLSFWLTLTNCYAVPTLFNCSDLIIILTTVVLLVVAVGWGHVLGFLVATALVIPALALYFFGISIWFTLLVLLLVPLLTYVIMDVWLQLVLAEAT